MKTKIQIKSISAKVLFEYEQEGNTIKETLESAVFNNADLRFADLRSADLRYADLRYADLPMFCKWNISIRDRKIRIGCEEMLIEEWDEFFNSDQEFETRRGTDEFKRIQAQYLAYKTYYEFLESK